MAATIRLLLALWTAFAVFNGGDGSPPEAGVIKCSGVGNTDCIVTNSFGGFLDRSVCRVAEAAFPSDELELIQSVSNATKRGQHMKVVTRYSHSIPKLSCPGGPNGEGLAISTQRLVGVIDVDPDRHRMTFGAGIMLHDLLDAAAAHGLALPASPYWFGVSLGGVIGTGSHGSSLLGRGSAVHDYVVGVRMVVPRRSPEDDGYYAKAVVLGEGDNDLMAAKLSLGVMGVVSQVTLQLQPMFKRSVTHRLASDAGLGESIAAFGSEWRFGDITWYPSLNTTVYREDTDVLPKMMATEKGLLIESDVDDGKEPFGGEEMKNSWCHSVNHLEMLSESSTEEDEEEEASGVGSGFNDFLFLQPLPAAVLRAGRAAEVALEAAGDAAGKCDFSRANVAGVVARGFGLKNHGRSSEFTGYPIVGNQNHIQSSGSCLFSPDDNLATVCGFDPRVTGGVSTFNTAVSIPSSRAADFFSDLKKLRDHNPVALCGVDLGIGILIRFIPTSTAYLGKPEDSVELDFIYYRSDDAAQPRLFEDVFEEMEQMALFGYGGLPHWGKNRDLAFVGMKDKLGEKLERFVEAMRRYDEDGLFSSDWTDAMLGLGGERSTPAVEGRPGCALDGLCICSSDDHCAPEKGYYCRRGRVYREARVCRKVDED